MGRRGWVAALVLVGCGRPGATQPPVGPAAAADAGPADPGVVQQPATAAGVDVETAWRWEDAPVLGGPLDVLWDPGGGELWTGGGDQLAHWDGGAWQVQALSLGGEPLVVRDLAGPPAGLWAVTRPAAVVRRAGGAWQLSWRGPDPGAELSAVWAGAPDDVWAAGSSEAETFALHWDGRAWTRWTVTRRDQGHGFPWLGPLRPTAVWGAPGGQAVVAGALACTTTGYADCQRPAFWRWDGAHWGQAEPEAVPAPTGPAAAMAAGEARYWDGAAWRKGGAFRRYWLRGPGDALLPGPPAPGVATAGAGSDPGWGLGGLGEVSRYQQGAWTTLAPGSRRFAALWGDGAGARWALDEAGSLYRRDAGQWLAAVPDALHPFGGWALGGPPADGWALSRNSGFARFDGTTWAPAPAHPLHWAVAAWGSGADLWASDRAGLAHFDGRAWTAPAAPAGVAALWGRGPADVWGGGAGADGSVTLSHWDGTAWTPVTLAGSGAHPAADNAVLALAGTPRSLWLVTADRRVLRWDGQAAREVGRAAGWGPVLLRAAAEDEVYLYDGQLRRWDGAAWHRAAPFAAEDIQAQDLWLAPGQAWLAGTGLLWTPLQ